MPKGRSNRFLFRLLHWSANFSVDRSLYRCLHKSSSVGSTAFVWIAFKSIRLDKPERRPVRIFLEVLPTSCQSSASVKSFVSPHFRAPNSSEHFAISSRTRTRKCASRLRIGPCHLVIASIFGAFQPNGAPSIRRLVAFALERRFNGDPKCIRVTNLVKQRAALIFKPTESSAIAGKMMRAHDVHSATSRNNRTFFCSFSLTHAVYFAVAQSEPVADSNVF